MGNTLVGGNDDPVTTKITERGKSYQQQVVFAASGMKGLRATMEDKHLYANELRVQGANEPLSDHSLFAVFDGHGGDFTSGYAAENFLNVLAKQPAMKQYALLPKTGADSRSDVAGVQLIRQALDGVFAQLDILLREEQQQKNDAIDNRPHTQDPNDESMFNGNNAQTYEHSGSTCVLVLLTPSHMIGCNAGDSRAVLRRAGHTLPLSFDHKPSEVSEKDRITEAGGYVKARRVDGDLAVSRALGDFVYKANEGLPANKQKVVPNPDFVIYPRMLEEDEFMILACDGIWDVASSKQCSDFVQQLLVEGESDLGVICEEALDTCLERNSKDNMTILIVGLPGMKTANSAVQFQNALVGRRAHRMRQQFAQHLGIVSPLPELKGDPVSAPMAAPHPGTNASPQGDDGFSSHMQNTIAPQMVTA
ncbi:linked kinase-associated serine/threonine phosphatase 2C [Seminavis robusta]|uniref:protein-serine/threonine phosphatase n=1 Tax=Seminavis robusta TaxID=568900 RepID=A0A9N8DEY8_9STRA|nr:linked kinase-associated serine/threonine phosphatase 2C [Seminavis robusta]|eukprot:Sro63_g035660.1 linked kinase-associated serine/threonine phosphatase 2C (421) ;mRNA; f:25695-26957